MKKVSVLIPVYNVENFVQRCAESIFRQNYDNLDVVFVDDCSPDNSIQRINDTLQDYPNRKNQVRIVKHKENRGLAAARNTGVDAAIGDYLMHVDSDDYLDEAAISQCVELLEKEAADVVVFGVNHVYPNKTITNIVNVPQSKDEYLKLMLSRRTRVNIWGVLYKTELYKKHDIQTIEGANLGEDYTVTPRLIYYAQKVVEIQKPLYYYIHYNDNSYTYRFSYKSVISHIDILKLLRNFFHDKNDGCFMKSIDYGETMLKGTAVLKWALTDNDSQYLEMIKNSFTTYNVNVPLPKKIILFLSDYPFLLKIYCRIGFHLKQLLK